MRSGSLFVVAALIGCSSPDPRFAACSMTAEEPLVNAAAVESYLGLAPEEIRAIVRVTNDTGPNAPICSGAFVAPDWVVTAAHCLVIDSAEIVVPGDDGRPPGVARVVESVAHPSLDAALLRVEAPESGFDALPLGLAAPDDRPIALGEVVEIAGYGRTETGDFGELRFLAEPVVAVEDDSLLVSGLGESGACEGDSGGPLLVRNGKGQPIVAGVLTSGAASCRERDRYVRLDTIRSWLEGLTGEFHAAEAPCGGIGEEGRCLNGAVLRCDGERLVAETCSEGAHCGWDRAERGFRCVAPANDPCSGVDSVGACEGESALRCNGGALVRDDCDCGQTCRIDGRTGAPHCADPSDSETR